MLTYKSGADVTDSVDTLRTGAQRKGGLAQVPSALALLQVDNYVCYRPPLQLLLHYMSGPQSCLQTHACRWAVTWRVSGKHDS